MEISYRKTRLKFYITIIRFILNSIYLHFILLCGVCFINNQKEFKEN